MGARGGWTLAAFLVLVPWIPGCGHRGEDESPLRPRLEVLDRQVRDVIVETEAHGKEVLGSYDPAYIRDREWTHAGYAGKCANEMQDTLAGIEHCSDGMGGPPNDFGFGGMLEAMEAEILRHMDEMGRMDEIGAMHDEERRHQHRMGEILDGMVEACAGMMWGAGWYSCPGGSGGAMHAGT